jgi:hypothetical protein
MFPTALDIFYPLLALLGALSRRTGFFAIAYLFSQNAQTMILNIRQVEYFFVIAKYKNKARGHRLESHEGTRGAKVRMKGYACKRGRPNLDI